VLTFHKATTVYPEVASVGADPALFTQVIVGQVIEYAVPSSIIKVIASPEERLSVNEVIFPVKVTV
jgi:hypothetical protein